MILTTIALVAQATPAPSPAPTAAASPSAASSDADKKIDTTAKAWFASLQQAKILDSSALEQKLVDALTPDLLNNVAAQIKPLGDPVTFDRVGSQTQGDSTYYGYKLTFKGGATWMFLIAFDTNGKISTLRVAPKPQ